MFFDFFGGMLFFLHRGLFGYITWRLLIVQKVKWGVDCTNTTQGDLSAPEGLTGAGNLI